MTNERITMTFGPPNRKDTLRELEREAIELFHRPWWNRGQVVANIRAIGYRLLQLKK